MATDARYRMKAYLTTNIDSSNLLKDDGVTEASFLVAYGYPPYPLTKVFHPDEKDIDIVFSIDTPESEPMMNIDGSAYGYKEMVPIEINCVDKSGVTGTTLRWQSEAELRSVLEDFPTGSQLSVHRMSDTEKRLGSLKIYSVRYIINYRRSATT